MSKPATKPAASKPTKPATAKPATTKPAATKPATAKPAATQPTKSANAKKPPEPTPEQTAALLRNQQWARFGKVFEEYSVANKDALKKTELLKIIRDANDEYTFLDEHSMPTFMKQAWVDATPDEDGLVRFDAFARWYEAFLAYYEGEKAKEAAKEAARAEAKAAAKLSALALCEGDGMWSADLKDLADALSKAWGKGKTPLLIDATGDEDGGFTALETYFSYSGHALFELKKMVVEVNMKQTKTLEEAQDEARAKLLLAMKRGLQFVMLLSNSAPPLKSRFCAAGSLPYTLLEDHAAVASCRGTAVEWKDVPWTKQLIRAEDKLMFVHQDFNVLAVTKFSEADYAEFLQAELPLDAMQHIKVTKQS